MAIFRKINVDFWEDSKIVDDFTPEDRYFMLYLMTNPHTNQVGCYGLTIRQMEFETGYNKETILKLLKRFSENLGVILYDENTKEVLIKNWYKYNWTSSPKIMACILKEAKSIKSTEFQNYIDTLLIKYEYSIDTVYIQKHNKNKNKNKEEEKEKDIISTNSKTKNFQKPTLEEIQSYCSERKNNIDAQAFYDYYEANGWKVGKNSMKDFKAAIRTWERNIKNNNQLKENSYECNYKFD